MHRTCTGLHRCSAHISWFLVWSFDGIPECAKEWVSEACVFSYILFLLLVCLVQTWCASFCFILPYIILYYIALHYNIFLYCMYYNIYKSVCFLAREWVGDLDGRRCGEELEEWREVKLWSGYIILEKILFSIKEENAKKIKFNKEF